LSDPASRPLPSREPRTPNPILTIGWKVSAALALLVGSFLLVGVVLPGTWSAEAETWIDAPPGRIQPLLASPAAWDAWTPWPEIDFRYGGPESGTGATRSWDDPEAGRGSFTIREATPSSVQYVVEVGDGRFVTHGEFTLTAERGGTRVVWREAGDLGSNPILAWTARSMTRRHGDELERRLAALRSAVEGTTP
jgi:hypothetical protein